MPHGRSLEGGGRGGTGRSPPSGQLELARDEKLRALQDEEKRYQIAKDLSDNLTVGYNTSEVIMARLMQTTSAKERVYQQSVSFFHERSVLTALSASFTGMHGLHESTQTLEKMKAGLDQSLETLSEIGGKVQEEALKAGYGPTIRAESVKKLVDRSSTISSARARSSTKCAHSAPRTPRTSGMPSRKASDGWRDWCKRAPSSSQPRAEFGHG